MKNSIEPSHYKVADDPSNTYEVMNVIEVWNLDFCLGNVLKYVYRAGRKDHNTHVEDLKKARWYLDRKIKKLEELKKL